MLSGTLDLSTGHTGTGCILHVIVDVGVELQLQHCSSTTTRLLRWEKSGECNLISTTHHRQSAVQPPLIC